MIESKDKRIVHFLMNPGFPGKISPFAKRYQKLRDGTLTAFVENERAQFLEYLEKYKNEELEEGEKNPVQFEDSPFFQFALTGVHRLCFSTADDPFYKTAVSRYYPEAIVFGADGSVITRISPENRKHD